MLSSDTVPGFVSFFSDVPGPCDEVLAQVGDDGVSTHHLGAEDVAEDTVVIVEVDSEQLSLQIGTELQNSRKRKCNHLMNSSATLFFIRS